MAGAAGWWRAQELAAITVTMIIWEEVRRRVAPEPGLLHAQGGVCEDPAARARTQ